MRAMVFHKAKEPLRLEEIAEPEPGPGEVLIRVEACGVCRTDLHIFDGDLSGPKVPLILGHGNRLCAGAEAYRRRRGAGS